ncbi:MAG: bifunctional DNA primase/polymerase, partial [Planctomycetaceae bacterium]
MTGRSTPTSTLDAAREYVRRGWSVVPIPYKQKRALRKGWPDLRLTADQLPEYFDQPANIGLLLGEPSGWLVDVDLDCAEALELADQYLPPTPAVTGRPGKLRSHRWYYAEGAVTKKHTDPITRRMIVELRSSGGQTIVGPSIHPDDGSQYEILSGEPAIVPAAMLAACVEALAKRVIEQRHGSVPTKPVVPAPPKSVRRADLTPAEVERRAVAYLDKLPSAISGQGGHAVTYTAATALVHGFEIDPDRALGILLDHYNPRCEPPWSEKELLHKCADAATKPHNYPRGWLLNEDRDEPIDLGVDISVLVGQASGKTHSAGILVPTAEVP